MGPTERGKRGFDYDRLSVKVVVAAPNCVLKVQKEE